MSDNGAITWTNETRKLSELVPWPRNPRQIKVEQVKRLQDSLDEFGQPETIAIGPGNEIYNGHQRLKSWADKYGDLEVDVRVSNRELSEKEREKLTVFLHKGAAGEWDFDTLANEFEVDDLLEWGFDESELELDLWLPEPPEDPGAQIDRAEELREQWGVESGQLWRLGEHRLICGDCTDAEVVSRLMGGDKAKMIFTDPPYGIGKEIINDDLKREDWVDFYLAFTNVMLDHLIENGYFYVWGYFETLSDYWQEIIKPRGDCNFRNFVIWKKTFIQGQKAEDFRQYPEHYAACLLGIYGMPFQNGPWSVSPNAEFYPEIFEPIRAYLDGERIKAGWSKKQAKVIAGHSEKSFDHWFGASQWTIPTREVYEAWQREANNDAFRKEYDAFRKEYDELRKEYDAFRKEYDELRKEYDELRGHFDNSFGFTDIWEFDELTLTDLHPTVKPVEVCERGIMTNSKEGEMVLDVFLGSGSTMIACERLGRKCRAVEISPAYCAVAIQRWADMTSGEPELVNS